MKRVLTILLLGLSIALGLSVYSLQKELLGTRKRAAFSEEKIENLQRELMRMSSTCNEKERFLDEIEQSIKELESKVQLETLERYIPKKTWSEIKPAIDRLKALQETRENRYLPEKQE